MSDDTDDLRATLTDAFKSSAEPEPAATPEPAVAAPETPAQATERARDEQGRFAAKAAQEAAEPAAQAAPAGTVAPAEAVPPVAEAPKVPGPPNSWSAQAKANWHTLPTEIQAEIAKREQDIAKFTGKTDEERAFGRDMQKVVQPYLPVIKAQGATPAQAVESLLNTAYVLHTGTPQAKQAALMQVAREYGIPLEGNQQSSDAYTQQLEQRLAQLEQRLTGADQEQEFALQQEVANDLAAFAADPRNSHFEAVKGHMAALLSSGEAKDLQDAYDRAVWASPDTRATLLAQQRAEEEAKRRADEAKRLEDARRKAVSVVGSPGLATAAARPNGDLSLRDELQANLRAARNATAV